MLSVCVCVSGGAFMYMSITGHLHLILWQLLHLPLPLSFLCSILFCFGWCGLSPFLGWYKLKVFSGLVWGWVFPCICAMTFNFPCICKLLLNVLAFTIWLPKGGKEKNEKALEQAWGTSGPWTLRGQWNHLAWTCQAVRGGLIKCLT